MTSTYTLYGQVLPRPYGSQTFQLTVGRRRVSRNKKGATRLKKVIANWDFVAAHYNEERVVGGYVKVVRSTYPNDILRYEAELKKIVADATATTGKRPLLDDQALVDAIRRGKNKEARQMIEDGANIHSRSKDGDTVLDMAMMLGNKEMETILRNRNAKASIRIS